jgi:hypothetical protein
MINLHKELFKYHEEEVKFPYSVKNELPGYRNKNKERLKKGLENLGYSSLTGFEVEDQGSYAMNTMIKTSKSDYDLDAAIIFDSEKLEEHIDIDNPEEARKLVEKALRNSGGGFKKEPKSGKNAVTIYYQDASNGYHIDFAVYRKYQMSEGAPHSYEHAGEDWRPRSPKEYKDWFDQQVDFLSPGEEFMPTVKPKQLKRIVRLLKRFAKSRKTWNMPGGIILTSLAVEHYKPDAYRDDVSFYNTLLAIKNKLNTESSSEDENENLKVINRSDRNESLLTFNDKHIEQMKFLKETLNNMFEELEVLGSENCTRVQGLSAWLNFFQDEYWRSLKNEEAQKSIDISNTDMYINLNVQVYFPVGSKTLYNIDTYKQSKGEYLDKDLRLKFSIDNTNISGILPQEVIWEVNNTGEEARLAGCLNFTRSNMLQTEENLEYQGKHTMTCRIVREGKEIANATESVLVGPNRCKSVM